MDKVKRISLRKKKRTFENLYCSTCDVWMTEYRLSCHLNSRTHVRQLSKQTSVDKRLNRGCAITFHTPEKQIEGYIIDGDTLENWSSEDSNIVRRRSPSPEMFDQVKRELFEREQKKEYEKLHEIPEHQLGIMDYDGTTWNHDSNPQWTLSSNSSTSSKSVSLLPQNFSQCEGGCNAVMNDDFPLNLLSGTFTQSACTEDHLNQIGFLKCSLCNPKGYKDYQDW
jgi:hypothetical protein